jgi:hypothetical protein
MVAPGALEPAGEPAAARDGEGCRRGRAAARRRHPRALPAPLALAAASAALLLAACGGTVKSPTEPAGGGPAGPALSFSQIQSQIFTPTCVKSGCHAASSAAGNMVLAAGQSYGQIVGRPAPENPQLLLVKPGDPEASYLVKKVRGDPDVFGLRMPLDGPPYLSSQQIAGIEGWIKAGAPNN